MFSHDGFEVVAVLDYGFDNLTMIVSADLSRRLRVNTEQYLWLTRLTKVVERFRQITRSTR